MKFANLAAFGALAGSMVYAQGYGETLETPKKFGMVVFPGFQALDVFGPLDVLNMISRSQNLSLSILSSTLDPVPTRQQKPANSTGPYFSESIVPTHTFDTAPSDLEVLMVPGGGGTRTPEVIAPAVAFVKERYPKLRYLITICTGGALVAKTGILDRRQATTNKKAWNWATSQGPSVYWVAKARWVVDGNIWTSSGVSAGIDVTYAFVAEMYGDAVAQDAADGAEYFRNKDQHNDPFAAMYNISQPQWPGAPVS